MYHTLLFDLDGTLLNTIQDLADAANWVCAQNGWPQHTLEEYKRFVGNGIPKLCERFTPPQARGPQQLAHTLAAFEARYGLHKQDATAPLSRHFRPAESSFLCRNLLWGTHQQGAPPCPGCDGILFSGCVFLCAGCSARRAPKPDPAGAKALMARMGAVPQTTLFVGDSDVDVFTAHNAGLPACGCCGGSAAKRNCRMREPSAWLPVPPNCWILSLHKNKRFALLFDSHRPCQKRTKPGVRFGSLFGDPSGNRTRLPP